MSGNPASLQDGKTDIASTRLIRRTKCQKQQARRERALPPDDLYIKRSTDESFASVSFQPTGTTATLISSISVRPTRETGLGIFIQAFNAFQGTVVGEPTTDP